MQQEKLDIITSTEFQSMLGKIIATFRPLWPDGGSKFDEIAYRAIRDALPDLTIAEAERLCESDIVPLRSGEEAERDAGFYLGQVVGDMVLGQAAASIEDLRAKLRFLAKLEDANAFPTATASRGEILREIEAELAKFMA